MTSPYILAVSQRMTVDASTGELRDALAQDWFHFLKKALPGVIAVPVPNAGEEAASWVELLGADGLLLTGGDDWGVFPLRDETERALWTWAQKHRHPVLGVCRGMQVVNFLAGGRLPEARDEKHVATRHEIEFTEGASSSLEVNSYHRGLLMDRDIAPVLKPEARSQDGAIEALRSEDGLVCGIMWHPEREAEPVLYDLELFKKLFGGEE